MLLTARVAQALWYATNPVRCAAMERTHLTPGLRPTLLHGWGVELGRLLLRSEWYLQETPCVPLGPATFTAKIGTVDFDVGADGAVRRLTLEKTWTYPQVDGAALAPALEAR
jgi:hypothetical protein